MPLVFLLLCLFPACRSGGAFGRKANGYDQAAGDRQVRGDDHVVLSMATALFCISPFLSSDITAARLWCCVLFLVGIFGGSHLPDADAVAAQGLHIKTCTGLLTSCICHGVVWIVSCVFWVTGCRFDGHHRCSLHTLYGVSVAAAAIAGLTGIVLTKIGWWLDDLPFLCAGLLCGGVLHLAEDCCTISGLQPFLPFSALHLKGGINTGDSRDQRPVWFAKVLVSMAALVIAGGYVYHIPADRLILPVLGATAFSWIVFYFLSQHLHTWRR